MKKLLVVLLTLISFTLFAQKENNNWCLPYMAKVSFNSPSIPPTSGTCNNTNSFGVDGYGYTCASVSNNCGQLLFYTDGVRVWDKTGGIMQGGSNIGGGISKGSWAEQGAVIVPKPGSETLYYIFTVCKFEDQPHPVGNHGGFHYSIVDISQNGGNGAVILNTIPLKDELGNIIDYDYSTNTGLEIYENSITTAFNSTNDGIWVTIFTRFHINTVVKRMAYSYLVDANGINGNPDDGLHSPSPNSYSPLPINCPLPSPIGCLDIGGSIKISPSGGYLCNEAKNQVDMYTFDDQTGEVEYDHRVYTGGIANAMPGYGIEFSPSSEWIYFSSYECGLCQDRSEDKGGSGGEEENKDYIRIRQAPVVPLVKGSPSIVIGEFEVPVDSGNNVIQIQGRTYGDLQLAPDGKIYACALEPTINPQNANLGVITQPDEAGLNCLYVNNGVTLASGTWQTGSLPQWVHKVGAVVCTPPEEGYWPKAYSTYDGYLSLLKDDIGNVFLTTTGIPNFPSASYNHVGVPFIPETGPTTMQYNSSGVTNWVNATGYPKFCFKSGIVVIEDGYGNYNFYDGTTGMSVPAPITLQQYETVIAETNNGTIITALNGVLYVHINHTIVSSINIGTDGYEFKFNPITNNLMVYGGPSGAFKVFNYNGPNLIPIVNNTTTPLSSISGSFVQIDDQDRLYVVDNGILKQYNYNTNTLTPVLISGFNNNNLNFSSTKDAYTGSRCLVFNQADQYLYALDLSNGTSKRLFASDNYWIGQLYQPDGDDFYLVSNYYSTLQIGNQNIPITNPLIVPIFLTKLNFQTDFSFKASEFYEIETLTTKPSIKIALVPNPATNAIDLTILQNDKQNSGLYSIRVTSRSGKMMVQKTNSPSNSRLNVSGWEKGVYYIEVIDAKGERSGSSFIKL